MGKYSKQFKEEAVRLSDEIGVKSAAEKLGVAYGTLSGWRGERSRLGTAAFPGSGHKIEKPGQNAREAELEREIGELRRANEILKDALSFFAADRRK
jgi:transposase